MADVVENYSKFEVCMVVRFFANIWSESEQDSLQITDCLQPEGFQPKGSVIVEHQI
jgi:hypothetical protein